MKRLQCGYEDECDTKDCKDCQRKYKVSIEITHAELTAVEDCGICDLKVMLKEKPEMMDNIQKRCLDLQKKIYEEIL